MNNFRFIGRYDIGRIMKSINDNMELFKKETWRQVTSGSAHKGTETIFVRYPILKSAEDVFESLEVVDREFYSETSVKNLTEILKDQVGLQPARILIVKLNPNSVIESHVDEGAYAESTERYHIALDTNISCFFTCGNESIHIPQGDCYWFDKTQKHSVVNGGDTPRTHFIIDFWKEKIC